MNPLQASRHRSITLPSNPTSPCFSLVLLLNIQLNIASVLTLELLTNSHRRRNGECLGNPSSSLPLPDLVLLNGLVREPMVLPKVLEVMVAPIGGIGLGARAFIAVLAGVSGGGLSSSLLATNGTTGGHMPLERGVAAKLLAARTSELLLSLFACLGDRSLTRANGDGADTRALDLGRRRPQRGGVTNVTGGRMPELGYRDIRWIGRIEIRC